MANRYSAVSVPSRENSCLGNIGDVSFSGLKYCCHLPINIIDVRRCYVDWCDIEPIE